MADDQIGLDLWDAEEQEINAEPALALQSQRGIRGRTTSAEIHLYWGSTNSHHFYAAEIDVGPWTFVGRSTVSFSEAVAKLAPILDVLQGLARAGSAE